MESAAREWFYIPRNPRHLIDALFRAKRRIVIAVNGIRGDAYGCLGDAFGNPVNRHLSARL